MGIEIPDSETLSIIKSVASEFSLDPNLIKAIIHKESGWKTFRTRYEPHWKYPVSALSYSQVCGITLETEVIHQATSWGLMQVMGAVCRENGFDGYLPQLCVPSVGIYYGAKKLSSLMVRYTDLKDAVASYNAGHPDWVDPQHSRYINQTYVVDVLRNLQDYKDAR